MWSLHKAIEQEEGPPLGPADGLGGMPLQGELQLVLRISLSVCSRSQHSLQPLSHGLRHPEHLDRELLDIYWRHLAVMSITFSESSMLRS